jgi:hypothetical protein
MALAFYMDVHVPAAITAGLRSRGIVVLTSQEDGTRTFDDESLLRRASELGRLLFTQDTDLLRIAHAWQNAGRSFSGVAFAPQLQVGIGELIEDLELIASCGSAEEYASQVVYLPWR